MSALVKGMEKALEKPIAMGGLEKMRVDTEEVPVEQRHLTEQAVGVTINEFVPRSERAAREKILSRNAFWSERHGQRQKFRPWNVAAFGRSLRK